LTAGMLNESTDRSVSVQLLNIAREHKKKAEQDLLNQKMPCIEYEKKFTELQLLRRLLADMEHKYRVYFDDDDSGSAAYRARED
jgi:hypothetical protein